MSRQKQVMSVLCTFVNGKLKLFDLAEFKRLSERFVDGQELVLTIEEPNRKRTDRQNKFWHAVVIPLLAEHCGYDKDEMKAALSLRFDPRTVRDIDGNEVLVPGHTSEWSVEEFNDRIEMAQRLGAEMGVVIPDPDPAWRQKKRAA